MVDFGTYQGHTILSNAMKNAVDGVTNAYKTKIQNEQWERNFKEQQENDAILREKAEYQLDSLKKDYLDTQARDSLLRDAYSRDFQPLLEIDSLGNLVPVSNYQQAINNLDIRSDIGSIMNANKDISYDTAVLTSGNLDNAYKKSILDTRKQFIGMDETAINKWFENNQDFALSYDRALVDAGIPRGEQTWGETMKFVNESESPELDSLGLASKGWGAEDYVVMHNDRDGWGGGIEFKGFSDPSSTEQKNANIILEALKTSKNNEAEGWAYGGDWLGDSSDTIWVDQTQDGFTVTENDALGNDVYEVKVIDGEAWVLTSTGSKMKKLSEMTAYDWE